MAPAAKPAIWWKFWPTPWSSSEEFYMQVEDFTGNLAGQSLGPNTMSARRNLLIVSTIGLIISRTGLVPTKISALGIEFSSKDLSSLQMILIAVVGYFFLTFVIYSTSDLLIWRIQRYFRIREIRENREFGEDDAPVPRSFFMMSSYVTLLRMFTDWMIPVTIAMLAIVSLITADLQIPAPEVPSSIPATDVPTLIPATDVSP